MIQTRTPNEELRMPVLGADMSEGTIVEWLVGPGDHVERGGIVAVVETDKADIEIEVFESGTIRELVVPPGEVVPVGTPIALIEPDLATTGEHHPPRHAVTTPTAEPETPPPRPADAGRVASPLIRHLADDRHLDLAHLSGSGPGGRVTRDDVERASGARSGSAPPPAPPDRRSRITPRARRLAAEAGVGATVLLDLAATGQVVTGDDVVRLGEPHERAADRATPVDPMRHRIATLMSRSWREIPHYHLEREIDVTALLERLSAWNEGRPVTERILPVATWLTAVAAACREVPECNGWWRNGFVPSTHVDLGLVISLRSGGVIVPTIERADDLDVVEVMARVRDLVDRARHGRLRSSDVGAASVTVTNLGDQGADAVFGVIHPPQVALIGFGAVRTVAVADGGVVRTGQVVRASLAGDHRAIDGLTGSRLLAALQRALDGLLGEEPT